MNICLFDLDGSMVDYEGALRTDLIDLMAKEELELLKTKSMWDLDEIPAIRNKIRLIKNQPGWWFNLPIIPEGMAAYRLAESLGFSMHILTKGPKYYSNAWKEKVELCQRHLGKDIDIHITSDKGMVYGKALYDDYPDYIERWLQHRPRGLVIMPVNDHNKSFEHPNVFKWYGTNVIELRRVLQIAYNREPNEPLNLQGESHGTAKF